MSLAYTQAAFPLSLSSLCLSDPLLPLALLGVFVAVSGGAPYNMANTFGGYGAWSSDEDDAEAAAPQEQEEDEETAAVAHAGSDKAAPAGRSGPAAPQRARPPPGSIRRAGGNGRGGARSVKKAPTVASRRRSLGERGDQRVPQEGNVGAGAEPR